MTGKTIDGPTDGHRPSHDSVQGAAEATRHEQDAGIHLGFRPDLQGLRAVAILLVVLAHAGSSLFSGGFVGVDVFFVLSGYLITGLLLRELEQTGRIRFLRFYARRLKRLLPALTLMILVTAGAALWLLSGPEAHAQLRSAPFAATWTSNLYFALTTLDYFDELAARDLFLHTWSLGVEEQFYLVWPLVLLAAALIIRRRQRDDADPAMLWTLGIALLASLGASVYWSLTAPQSAFYLMPSRIWQFALGAMVYVACRRGHRLSDPREAPKAAEGNDQSQTSGPPPAREPLAEEQAKRGLLSHIPARLGVWAGLALILASAAALDSGLAYPVIWMILPSVGAAIVIASGQGPGAEPARDLAHPALVWLGDRSYSWYLWHWPALMLGAELGLDGRPLATLSLVLLSLLAAILSYRLVELPFWKGRLSHGKPLHTLLASLLIMAAMIGLLTQALRDLRPTETIAEAARRWKIDVPIIYRMPCDTWYHDAGVRPCIMGPADARQTVVLLGDSVGLQWFSLAPALFPAPDWHIVVLTKSSCPMVDEDYYYPRIKQVYRVCSTWRDAVLDELDRLRPDVLLMGSAATYDFTNRQWTEGSARIFERVGEAAGQVFVIAGTPTLGFDGPGCLHRNLKRHGEVEPDACVAMDRLQAVEPVARHLVQAAARFPNVEVLDLNDLVCPGGLCSAITPSGQAVFRDSQHLTDSFVRAQVEAIRERMSAKASQ